MVDTTIYLKCHPGDIAPLVLLTGDPARVDRIGAILQQPHEISHTREFAVVTGTYNGTPVSAVSGGIGAPSTAIAMEELKQVGVRTIVRIGTMMGVVAPMQSVVLATGAVRFEGTSAYYLPLAYPAMPHWELVQVLADTARHHDLDVRMGLVATYDAFYPEMAPSVVERGNINLDLPRHVGVLSMDMETSLVFAAGMTLGIAVASMCLVTVQAEPHRHLDTTIRADLDERMVSAALTGLVTFGQPPPTESLTAVN